MHLSPLGSPSSDTRCIRGESKTDHVDENGARHASTAVQHGSSSSPPHSASVEPGPLSPPLVERLGLDDEHQSQIKLLHSFFADWRTCVDELRQLQAAATSVSTTVRGLTQLIRHQQNALGRMFDKYNQHLAQLQSATDKGESPLAPDQQQCESLAVLLSSSRNCSWVFKWDVIKRCRGGLLSVYRDAFAKGPREPVAITTGWPAYKAKAFRERPVTVDAVVDDGQTWLKFAILSQRSLEQQVLIDGWDSDEDSEDAEDAEHAGDGAGESKPDTPAESHCGLDKVSLVRTIQDLVLAARWNHCRRIHLVLPEIQEGKSPDVDRLLRYVRQLGGRDVDILISTADASFLQGPAPPASEAIPRLPGRDPLVGEDCLTITSTVNLDPSMLIALASDMSHGPVALQPEAQQRILEVTNQQPRQADDGADDGTDDGTDDRGAGESASEDESAEATSTPAPSSSSSPSLCREHLLATLVYPAMRGRKLVCTQSAADYFRRVIGAIATHSEEVRADLLLPSTGNESEADKAKSPEERRAALQRWSRVPVPDDLQLPVEIVPDVLSEDVAGLVAAGKLPPMAVGVSSELSRLNLSVYLQGWMRRITTLSGHRGIERQILLAVARHWTARDGYGPAIWYRHICGYLIHRDKPKNWRDLLAGKDVPPEIMRWTLPWTTWGRGINMYGLPDSKAWEGVGHADMQDYGRPNRPNRHRRSKARKDAYEKGLNMAREEDGTPT